MPQENNSTVSALPKSKLGNCSYAGPGYIGYGGISYHDTYNMHQVYVYAHPCFSNFTQMQCLLSVVNVGLKEDRLITCKIYVACYWVLSFALSNFSRRIEGIGRTLKWLEATK